MSQAPEALLRALCGLSHEFGGPEYVKGGGGNSSWKEKDTLWIKASGTTLNALSPSSFVALDRRKLAEIYRTAPPEDPYKREALVKQLLLASVRRGSQPRPSVESPLHDSFQAAFVLHTHPPLVNALTCGKEGREAASKLFPEFPFVPYTDPGYCLSLRVRRELASWRERFGREPEAVFLQNHGLLVAADTPQRVREVHGGIMEELRRCCEEHGLELELRYLEPASEADVAEMVERIRSVLGPKEAPVVIPSPPFSVPAGPLTPDHIVYAHAFPFREQVTKEAVDKFVKEKGFAPRIFVDHCGVFAVGKTQSEAELALTVAKDGALVVQLCEVLFGGVRYMTEPQWRFIESWEVEAYRRRLAAKGL